MHSFIHSTFSSLPWLGRAVGGFGVRSCAFGRGFRGCAHSPPRPPPPPRAADLVLAPRRVLCRRRCVAPREWLRPSIPSVEARPRRNGASTGAIRRPAATALRGVRRGVPRCALGPRWCAGPGRGEPGGVPVVHSFDRRPRPANALMVTGPAGIGLAFGEARWARGGGEVPPWWRLASGGLPVVARPELRW